eukprot:1161884-Pelagomonas_calceolata.AAC.2
MLLWVASILWKNGIALPEHSPIAFGFPLLIAGDTGDNAGEAEDVERSGHGGRGLALSMQGWSRTGRAVALSLACVLTCMQKGSKVACLFLLLKAAWLMQSIYATK